MGHNLSRRAARDAALATPIGRYGTCVLAVSCPSCRDRRELRIDLILTDANRDELVGRFLIRLRCSICRSPPETVRLQRRGGQGRPSQEIPLIGPESD